jgi:hypothetical protein
MREKSLHEAIHKLHAHIYPLFTTHSPEVEGEAQGEKAKG